MKKFLFYLIVFIPCIGFSQNTGYIGRKFILKTDVLYGRYVGFRNLEAEYTIGRKWSVAVGVRTHKGDCNQKFTDADANYIGNEAYPGRNRVANNIGVKELSKATLSFTSFKVMLRNYFNGVSPKAPRGWYWGLLYEQGTAKLTGAAQFAPVPSGVNSVSFIEKSGVTIKNIDLRMYEISLGYQEIFNQRIIADFSFGLCSSRFNTNGEKSTLSVTTLSATNVGPNLLPFGKRFNGSNAPYTSSLGFSAYLKIGYLIF